MKKKDTQIYILIVIHNDHDYLNHKTMIVVLAVMILMMMILIIMKMLNFIKSY